jgi:opacity protein-like surface antigen
MLKNLVTIGLAGFFLSASQVYAADPFSNTTPTETVDGWSFTFAPYVWAASASGSVGQFGLPPAKLDQSFADTLSSLDVGIMAVAEARYRRFILQADLSYVQTTEASSTPLGVFANRVGVRSRAFRGAFLGGYEVFQNEHLRIDVGAGAQVLSVDTRLSFTGGLLNGTARSDSATWVDALAGVRTRVSVTQDVFLSGWAYAGAGQSDLVWDVMAGVGYSFTDNVSGFMGYRANGVDYSSNGFVYDVVQQGPVGGLVFRF